ncbi:alpha-2-macroglobulin-like protein 1 [Bombina bombina]|uniref:alpha-2-macroglobulin-like protein 1 n=1 Tax=Bombina bombina TaxID=8345 RepID=UPI00235AC515|nr:alpha-2-macroglobulin-like protein 1 [Bombina bombina]
MTNLRTGTDFIQRDLVLLCPPHIMWAQLVLSMLVTSALGQTSLTNYLVLIPAEIHYPSTESACIHVSGAREQLLLTLTLQSESMDTIINQQYTEGPSLFQCVSFKVLPPTRDHEEVVTIHLSLVGPNTEMSESQKILIRNMGTNTVIQMDKHIYKPGQEVRSRIVTFNREFLAVNDNIPLVELQDSLGNRIGQWLNVSPKQGIVDLSFSLDSEAPEGTYTIRSPNGRRSFHVSEYVLPTFEVNFFLPHVVTLLDEKFQLKTCGRYTVGKPVQGEVKIQLCRRAVTFHWYPKNRPKDVCKMYTGRTDRTGCLSLEITTDSYQLHSYDYQLRFDVEASLVEDETGVQMNGRSSCRVSAMIAKVSFEESEISDSFYKQGLRYKSMIKLMAADGTPLKSKTIYLIEKYGRRTTERMYETDENGLVYFTLDTKLWGGQMVTLTATQRKEMTNIHGQLNPYYQDAHRTLQPFTTVTNSFLKVQPMDYSLSCDHKHNLEIDYIIRRSELMRETSYVELNYVVMARKNIVQNGQILINVTSSSVAMGTLELPLLVTAHMSPLAHILVYTILGNNRIAADTEQFTIEKCFSNKVNLDFSSIEGAPGSNVSLSVQAYPGSLCSVRVVDESVFFLRPESELSSDTLYSLIAQSNRFGYDIRVQDDVSTCWEPLVSRHYRPYYDSQKLFLYEAASSTTDVFTLIKGMGLKILSNTDMKSKNCRFYPPAAALSASRHDVFHVPPSNVDLPFWGSDPYNLPDSESFSHDEVAGKPRKNLPETWIWDLIPVGHTGKATLYYEVPDSITDWKATMLCMGEVGIGIAPISTFRVFKSFFADMTLPYSVIRGETFALTASVYNYLNTSLMVKATLVETPEIEVTKRPTSNYTQCVPAEQVRVFTWDVRAVLLGTVHIELHTETINTEVQCGDERSVLMNKSISDGIIRTFLIKPEGIPVETTQNLLLCAAGNLSTDTIYLSLPAGAVPGSGSAGISIVGDMLGIALEGIDHLLVLPFGCGEQNMARFAPNIYLLNYLRNTGQLTEHTKTRGVGYLLHGYHRQLLFRRDDASFSAFGMRDSEGSTWLTAFTMKTLQASCDYIYVDDTYIDGAFGWLRENQLPSGCFRCRGKLFKTSLQGGVNDEVSLSAYVTLSLLELKLHVENSVVQNALQCLRNTVGQVISLYTKALLAYTFTMSTDYEIRDALLQDLYKNAVKKGGQIYWSLNPNSTSKQSYLPNSFEVELASYVVLAHVAKANPTVHDINNASSIVSWISKQQNPNGGFASTQDTVVALDALSRFSEITHSGYEGLEVNVTPVDGNAPKHQLWVDSSTKLLVQKIRLGKLPGAYTVHVHGEGCIYLQAILHYNSYPAGTSPVFELQLSTSGMGCEGQSAPCFNLTINVRYTGPRQVTNMILIEADLLSGYSPVAEALNKLETHNLVKKIETKEGKVVIYVSELFHETQHFSLLATQNIMVGNLESQMVTVYDYYTPDEQAHAMYNWSPKHVD